MRSGIRIHCLSAILLLALTGCGKEQILVRYTFDSVNNRIWVAEDFWTEPLEDWCIIDNHNVNHITR